MTLSPSALDSLQTLCVGLALSGLLASAFELFTERRASFSLLERGGVTASTPGIARAPRKPARKVQS